MDVKMFLSMTYEFTSIYKYVIDVFLSKFFMYVRIFNKFSENKNLIKRLILLNMNFFNVFLIKSNDLSAKEMYQ